MTLKWGLSFEQWGRLWLLVTPRSASKKATGLDAIEVPRSAWIVSCPGLMPCWAMESANSASASLARSERASIQPTT